MKHDVLKEKQFTIKAAALKTGMSQSFWRRKIFEKKVCFIKKANGRVYLPESSLTGIVSEKIIEPERS